MPYFLFVLIILYSLYLEYGLCLTAPSGCYLHVHSAAGMVSYFSRVAGEFLNPIYSHTCLRPAVNVERSRLNYAF